MVDFYFLVFYNWDVNNVFKGKFNMELEQVKQVVNESIKAAMGSIGEVIKATVKEELKKEEPTPTKSVHQSIVEEREKENKLNEQLEREKEDAVFCKTIYNEIEGNKPFLPADTKKIVDTCISSGDTDSYKAELIKKEIIERVFEIQDNIDKLSDHSRAKVIEYLGLTDEAKLAKSREVWNLVNEVVNVKKNIYAQEEKKKQKMGLNSSTRGFTAKQEEYIQNSKAVLFGQKKLDY